MENHRELSHSDRALLYQLGYEIYYNSIELLLKSTVNSNTEENSQDRKDLNDLVTALLKAEITYMQNGKSLENSGVKAGFSELMAEAVELYGSIENTQLRDILLLDMYNYYLEIYNSLEVAE